MLRSILAHVVVMDVRVYQATGKPAVFAKEPILIGSFFNLRS